MKPKIEKIKQLLREEISGASWRMHLARFLLNPLPPYTGSRIRVHFLRLLGFQGISSSAMLWGLPTITGQGVLHSRLTIGDVCGINIGCLFNLGANITIGDYVFIGQEVMILTETHRLGSPQARAGDIQAQPVTIGNGCWLGARATILPGVTISDGAVVAAGAMVTKDVPPNTVVGGVPAKVLRTLDSPPITERLAPTPYLTIDYM